MKSILSLTSLVAAALAQSYTAPGAQTYGALNSPSGSNSVTTGQTFTVQWVNNAAPGATVSLVLCNGPGSNCVLQSTAIASGISAAANSYSWNVPCSLPAGVASTATGYGMLIIVDGTGQFQYSTQFSVNTGSSCSSSTSSTSSTSSSSSSVISSSSSLPISGPPASISGRPTIAPASDGWYSWTSTFNTTSTPAYTASSAVVTSAAVSSSKPASVASVAASATSARPSSYTGAATMPSAFINAFGLVGAAGLAMLAL